jgi:hypothetical protein
MCACVRVCVCIFGKDFVGSRGSVVSQGSPGKQNQEPVRTNSTHTQTHGERERGQGELVGGDFLEL